MTTPHAHATVPVAALSPDAATRAQRALLAVTTAVGLLVLFAVLVEGGSVSALGGSTAAQTLHEVFHDARHLLGVPCH